MVLYYFPIAQNTGNEVKNVTEVVSQLGLSTHTGSEILCVYICLCTYFTITLFTDLGSVQLVKIDDSFYHITCQSE